jgi:hypothetical protein
MLIVAGPGTGKSTLGPLQYALEMNLRIRKSCPMGLSLLCGAESGSRSCAGPRSRRVHDLPLSARHDSSKPAGHKFLMRRFESLRPSQPSPVSVASHVNAA